MTDPTFAEGRFAAQRAFEGDVLGGLWEKGATDIDLRACSVGGPGFSRGFALIWATAGRLHRGAQVLMDPGRTTPGAVADELLRRVTADGFFWEDLGAAGEVPDLGDGNGVGTRRSCVRPRQSVERAYRRPRCAKSVSHSTFDSRRSSSSGEGPPDDLIVLSCRYPQSRPASTSLHTPKPLRMTCSLNSNESAWSSEDVGPA